MSTTNDTNTQPTDETVDITTIETFPVDKAEEADGQVAHEEVPAAKPGQFSIMAGGAAGPARDILKTVESIVEQVERDNQNSSDFTQALCRNMRAKYPAFNFVICHVKHDYRFDGSKGVDWDHWHEEFDIQIGGTIGYEVYWTRSDTFTRWGDGGFLNWAYQGRVQSRSSDGRTIVFARP